MPQQQENPLAGRGELLGYIVVTEETSCLGITDRQVMWTAVLPDLAAAEKERARSQAHTDIDADQYPGCVTTHVVAELRTVTPGASSAGDGAAS